MKKSVFCLIFTVLLSSCAATAPQGTQGIFPIDRSYGDLAPYGSHPGIDYTVGTGTPVIAASNGRVISISELGVDGSEVSILHGRDFVSTYAHLSKFFVQKGQWVRRGQLIALSGASNNYGRIGYQHLHFGLCKIGQSCRNAAGAYNPDGLWLEGKPQCFDPQKDYSGYSLRDITLPIACGDYGKALTAEGGK